MAALDADEAGDLALFADAVNIIGRVGHLEDIGVPAGQAVDDVDLFEGLANDAAVLACFRRHVDRPELRPDAALEQPGNVGLQPLLLLQQVDLAEGEIILTPQLPWQVVVAVDKDRLAMDAQGLLRELDRLAPLELMG